MATDLCINCEFKPKYCDICTEKPKVEPKITHGGDLKKHGMLALKILMGITAIGLMIITALIHGFGYNGGGAGAGGGAGRQRFGTK